MTKEENIDYLTLRAEECRLPEDQVLKIRTALAEVSEKDYEKLKRISEPEFRSWCKEASNRP
ncbi:MAG: hypothetical protein JXR86_10535 [Spirochaetales bacterium]|nr:hypothetical protein [Spirochaetales bacterium]